MKDQASRQLYAPSRAFLLTTLLVICALFTHSFDNCSAHVGLPDASATVLQTATHTEHIVTTEFCNTCILPASPNTACCTGIAETAVSSLSQGKDNQFTASATIAALPSTKWQLIIVGELSDTYNSPPPSLFLASTLRPALPSRAPPVLA